MADIDPSAQTPDAFDLCMQLAPHHVDQFSADLTAAAQEIVDAPDGLETAVAARGLFLEVQRWSLSLQAAERLQARTQED